MRSSNEAKLAKRYADSSSTLWLAEAGMQRVKYEKNTNNCTGMVRQDTGVACTDCTCGNVTKIYQASFSGLGDIDATLNSTNTTITATGSVPSRSATGKVTRNLQGTFASSGLFNGAVYAKGTIQFSNSAMTNSYNSTTGAYNVNGNIGSNGHVGTNATSAGAITMSNSSTINGNASTGTGGTIVQNNSSTVTGTKTYTNNVTLPNVVVPASLTALPLIGHIHNSNGYAQTITTGNYKYTTWTLSNSAVITINGDVTVYLTSGGQAINLDNSSRIDITNGSSLTIYTDGYFGLSNSSTFNNVAQAPSKLQIYSTYAGTSSGMTLSNNTVMYGAVYMPNAPVTNSNSTELYGAVVAKSVNFSNSTMVHYDEALANLANPFGGTSSSTISNWQEY